jgi:dienelactone hydrolase
MKSFISKAVLAFFTVLMLVSCTNSNEKQQVTEEDYLNATAHMSNDLRKLVYNQITSTQWSGDDFLLYSKRTPTGKAFVLVNSKTKEKKAAFDHTKLAESISSVLGSTMNPDDLPLYNIEYSNVENAISFTIDDKIYSCNLNDYTFTTSEAKKGNTVSRNEHVSPNGKLAAYIDDFNLWVRDLETNTKTQLTFDGVQDYGYATNNAGWVKSENAVLKWSPNSDKIATFQQDARGVGEMYLTSTNVGHPKLEAWKHPLPGDLNVFRLERVIIHLGNTPKVVRLKMPADFQRGTTTDHVAGRGGILLDAQWKNDGSKFAFVSSSRDHKIAHLQIADALTGNVESIHKEEVDTYYESGVNQENWKVLFDSNEFIWFSEKSDWGHLYLYDLPTKELKNQITKGDWAVQQLLYIDELSRELFFTAGGKEDGNPYHKYLYKVGYEGTNIINLTPESGAHSINFSPNRNYFIDTYSTTSNPPITVLRDRNGKKIADLETVDISELKAKNWQQPIEFNVKARDNKTDLYGIMYLPSHYNENQSYPVLNYLYPGPQSGSVGNYAFRVSRSDFQAVAELGFIVVTVDAMGTPARSKSFHDAYYGNMGDNGLPDNITTIKQLAETYKGIDLERVGIWGHSGGGFASTRAVFAYPDFYDVAVSGSGNHDNRNYEADWGEKWQGLLQEVNVEGQGEGTTNYDNQANQLIAGNLKGKLLITHGTMDDNVHPSSTMLVVEALIKANKDFDMILFPNKRHGYGDMTKYMTRKRWDYWVKHLLKKEPPVEFSLDNF